MGKLFLTLGYTTKKTCRLQLYFPILTQVRLIVYTLLMQFWSGRRDSNSRPIAWKAMTLPLSYSRSQSKTSIISNLEGSRKPSRGAFCKKKYKVWRGQDSNLRRPEGRRVYSPLPLTTRPPLPTLLSPKTISKNSGTYSFSSPNHTLNISWRRESNPQPADYKSAALPLSYASTKKSK